MTTLAPRPRCGRLANPSLFSRASSPFSLQPSHQPSSPCGGFGIPLLLFLPVRSKACACLGLEQNTKQHFPPGLEPAASATSVARPILFVPAFQPSLVLLELHSLCTSLFVFLLSFVLSLLLSSLSLHVFHSSTDHRTFSSAITLLSWHIF